jgi:hypothetical protein
VGISEESSADVTSAMRAGNGKGPVGGMNRHSLQRLRTDFRNAGKRPEDVCRMGCSQR